MEILQMDVTRTELPTGQPVIRVGFHGEGGENVTVHMSPAVDGAYEPDQAIIDRAKGILVQIATFPTPRAESNSRNEVPPNPSGDLRQT